MNSRFVLAIAISAGMALLVTGMFYQFAMSGDSGDGGYATSARLNYPYSLRLYDREVLLISDHWNNKLRAVKLA